LNFRLGFGQGRADPGGLLSVRSGFPGRAALGVSVQLTRQETHQEVHLAYFYTCFYAISSPIPHIIKQ